MEIKDYALFGYSLLLVLVIGTIFTGSFLTLLRYWLDEKKISELFRFDNIKNTLFECIGWSHYPPYGSKERRIKPLWTGTIERIFFTICVTFDLSGTIVGMMAWIVAKMGTRWMIEIELIKIQENPNTKVLPRALSALLGNLISMMFALIGGLLIRYSIFGEIY